MDWTCEPSPRIGLLDRPTWTVPHGPSLMDRPSWTIPLWIGQAWSLKNKGLFQIALIDRPRGYESLNVTRGSATRGAVQIVEVL